MKIIGRNFLGLYLCIPDEKDFKNAKTEIDKIYIAFKTGFYINPANW